MFAPADPNTRLVSSMHGTADSYDLLELGEERKACSLDKKYKTLYEKQQFITVSVTKSIAKTTVITNILFVRGNETAI